MLNLDSLLTGDIRKASTVIRYSSIDHGRDQNIAEHSYYVILYALLIAKDCIKDGMEIDLQRVLVDCVMHDVDECLSGDFVRSFKYANEEMHRMMDAMASTGCKKLLVLLGCSELHENWVNAKDVKTLEGQIVLLVDLLEVVAYCISRIKVGNREMQTILRGAYEKFIKNMAGLPIYERYKTEIAEIVMNYVANAPKQEFHFDIVPAEEEQTGGKGKKKQTDQK